MLTLSPIVAFACISNILISPILAYGLGHSHDRPTGYGHHSSPSVPYKYVRGCKEIIYRREWRYMDADEKQGYISAIQCLQSLPANNATISAARTRFDEFQAYHMFVANKVHVVGQFLPWHRRFVSLFETALREECRYTGGQPYWDWTLDAGEGKSLVDSPIFDPITGFGGNGVPGTYEPPKDFDGTSRINEYAFVGCVQDGPFANYTLHLGPGKFITDHCLARGINDTDAKYISINAMANATNKPTFEEFRIEVEGEPVTDDHRIHDGGHAAVGGEMSNFFSSPGDPLFYLHHATLDRIWWQWQQSDPRRLYEISGRSTVYPPYMNVTLQFPLEMSSLGPLVTIGDVMDIYAAPSCYTYL